MKRLFILLAVTLGVFTSAFAQHHSEAKDSHDGHEKVGMRTKFEIGLSFNQGKEFGFGALVGYSFTPEHKVQFTGNFNGKYYSGLYIYEHAIGRGPFYGFLGAGYAFENVEEEIHHNGHTMKEKEWCGVIETKLGVLYHINHHLGLSASVLPNYNVTEHKFGTMGELEVVFFF